MTPVFVFTSGSSVMRERLPLEEKMCLEEMIERECLRLDVWNEFIPLRHPGNMIVNSTQRSQHDKKDLS